MAIRDVAGSVMVLANTTRADVVIPHRWRRALAILVVALELMVLAPHLLAELDEGPRHSDRPKEQANDRARPRFDDEQLGHWAFHPPIKAPLPEVHGTSWPRQPIDYFILAELEAHELRPAPPADKATLLRRVTYGLTGLPPTPDEIERFLVDDSPEAFTTVVDRLLASHHYGEQWARYWLDVVRYADTVGGTANFPFALAHRYRDYVIAAFNKDKPYDRFVQELVAGDLLPSGDAEIEVDRMTGPGALLLGPHVTSHIKIDVAADQIGMLTRALIGLNITCARCHDHPFEPLTSEDFYALAGIFTSTESGRFQRDVQMLDGETIQVLSVQDGTVGNMRVHYRGNPDDLGGEVRRRFPDILAGEDQAPLSADRSGRLELADWLTREDHPLTSRVIVNRIWQRHFGVGLVRDPDNFGISAVTGPSHPRLLDWLALHLIDEGWSLKAVHRTIVMSATYQQSSSVVDWMSANPQPNAVHPKSIDPTNRLLWRQNRRRLEGEEIRDSLLFISGRLDPATGGSLLANLGFGNDAELKKGGRLQVVVDNYDSILQRTIYQPVIRSEMHMSEVLSVFDFPSRDEMTGRRQTSTNASQALLLMNSPFVIDQARHTAELVLAAELADDRARVQKMFRCVLGRAARDDELSSTLDFVTAWQADLKEDGTDAEARRHATWQNLCQAMLMFNEFVYVN